MLTGAEIYRKLDFQNIDIQVFLQKFLNKSVYHLTWSYCQEIVIKGINTDSKWHMYGLRAIPEQQFPQHSHFHNLGISG